MIKAKKIHPPRWARRFLEWYCKPELLEDLQGDLNEYFERNLKSKGPRKARMIYVIDVGKFLRPYTLNKPDFLQLIINWIMLGSYIKTSGRNIVRNKLFSAINIIGLAASMSVGLLLISVLHDLLSYDRFHVNRNRIYRVIDDKKYLNENVEHFASTSIAAGREIRDEIPGIEKLVIMRRPFSGDFKSGEKTIPLNGYWAEPSFFKIFTFPLLEGSPETALNEPWAIVLTRKAAKKIFGNDDPLGKSVVVKNSLWGLSDGNFIVTGIMKDIPRFSYMQFEALGSFSTLDITHKDNPGFFDWENIYQNYVYILLPPDGDPANLRSNLARIGKTENSLLKNQHIKIRLKLQPLSKIVISSGLYNEMGSTTSRSIIWFFTGLFIVILISACFNFTNLSIARSLQRSREVGIRRTVGAKRVQVLYQFLMESMIIALFALAFSIIIFFLVRPLLISANSGLHDMVTLQLSPMLVLCFIIFSLLTGILAGLFPAIFYSRISALQTIKKVPGSGTFRYVHIRRTLLILQFTFTLIFITSTMIIYKQYKHILSFDLGFNTSNVLNIDLRNNK